MWTNPYVQAICLCLIVLHVLCVISTVWYLIVAKRYFCRTSRNMYIFCCSIVLFVPQAAIIFMLVEALVLAKSLACVIRYPYLKWLPAREHCMCGIQVNNMFYWNRDENVVTYGTDPRPCVPVDMVNTLAAVDSIFEVEDSTPEKTS